jgi:YqjK-like protein
VSERFKQLTARHSQLRARSAQQRQDLAQTADEIESKLSGIERGVAIVRGVARKPALLIVGVALIALLGPNRLLRWASRGALFYSTARRVMRSVR